MLQCSRPNPEIASQPCSDASNPITSSHLKLTQATAIKTHNINATGFSNTSATRPGRIRAMTTFVAHRDWNLSIRFSSVFALSAKSSSVGVSSSRYQPVESREDVRECLGRRRGDEEAERMGDESRVLTAVEEGLIGVVCERTKLGSWCGCCCCFGLGEGGMIEMVEPVRPLRTREVVFMAEALCSSVLCLVLDWTVAVALLTGRARCRSVSSIGSLLTMHTVTLFVSNSALVVGFVRIG